MKISSSLVAESAYLEPNQIAFVISELLLFVSPNKKTKKQKIEIIIELSSVGKTKQLH